mmetsp:Transcript_41810/g.48309  ORF Transcript_41810/g.48309 Transcript_41810/m.48309 type:complete len:299 (+) Transcript_41810:600-1496(+)
MVVGVRLCDLEVAVDSFREVSAVLPHLRAFVDVLGRSFGSQTSGSTVPLVDLVDKMRSVLLSDSQSLSVHPLFHVCIDGGLRIFGVDETSFGLCKVSSVEEELGLVQKHALDALWVVLPGNLQSGVPILAVLVHSNSFGWLVGLDELLFSLFVSLLVFKEQSVFQVHVWKLVLRVKIRESERFIKVVLVCFELNRRVDESILDEEGPSAFSSHIVSDFDSNVFDVLLVSMSLGHSDSLVPHLVNSVHVDRASPVASFDIVMFSLFEVPIGFAFLGKMDMSVFQQILSVLGHKLDHLVV